MKERTLFDDEDDDQSTWEEVPQARFLSWSPERQAKYCALRDRDSAAYENDPFMFEFYLTRSKMYEEMAK